MQPHFLALQGFAKLLETVQLVNRRMNPQLRVSGIVLTMFDAQTKLTTEVVAELEGFIQSAKGKPLPWAEARIFETKVRRNIKLAESPSFGQTIIAYGPTSNGAADYRALAREVIEMSEPSDGPEAKPAPIVSASAPAPAPPRHANAHAQQFFCAPPRNSPPKTASNGPTSAQVENACSGSHAGILQIIDRGT